MKIKHTLQTVLTIVVSFDEFRKFLEERNSYDDYAIHTLEYSISHKITNPIDINNPYTWISNAFVFDKPSFWDSMDNAWRKILDNYKIKNHIDNIEGVLHDEEEPCRFIVEFKQFIEFLKAHNALSKYFSYVKQNRCANSYIHFLCEAEPQFWMDAFIFENALEPDFWYLLKEVWQKIINYDPSNGIEYTAIIDEIEIKKYF